MAHVLISLLRLQYLWHTDNWCIILEEPQLKALHGKKLKINVRLGERRQPNLCPCPPYC